ncbi:hypothetical protein EVAR_10221_1 [Eumeta japonica]|uniref:Uncharacterized protein n=1 Tax=Eumeta variegata TaxID=151549 RepID=A0A4C1TGX9_EUMVA|nr:hypothetical protein EVAR_10221_1 [Eumeta japonica]
MDWREIARSELSLARLAQAERDYESCFSVRASGVHRFIRRYHVKKLLCFVGVVVFSNLENEIQQILMGDNSDNEDDLLLDEEDQRLLTQDDDQGLLKWKLKIRHFDKTRRLIVCLDLPSTAEPETEAQVTHQPAFKWSQRTYLPNIFRNVEYEFGKVKICQVEADTLLTPFDIFCAATNFDDLVHYIVSESVRYAHQNG